MQCGFSTLINESEISNGFRNWRASTDNVIVTLITAGFDLVSRENCHDLAVGRIAIK